MTRFDNPVDKKALQFGAMLWVVFCLIGLTTFFWALKVGVIVFPLGFSIGLITYVGLWTTEVYLRPRTVDIMEQGVGLGYKHRKPRFVEWSGIVGVASLPDDGSYIISNPLGRGSLVLTDGPLTFVTAEIADRVSLKHLEVKGTPLPRPGRNEKDRQFRKRVAAEGKHQ